MAEAGRIIEPGRNCWRASPVRRAAVLIDAETYFRAFRAAVLRACRSIYIAAWDIHTRTPLLGRTAPDDGWPVELGRFLEAVLKHRPRLRCHILLWDVPLFYVPDRQLLPRVRFGWLGRGRCRLHLDGALPIEASQHQKIVVIDDALAFSGGLDITEARWDSRSHLPGDCRRRRVNGATYPPFHDAQMVVDGQAAADLGVLFRERWRRATGETLKPPETVGDPAGDPWPPDILPTFRDTSVAIARTMAPYGRHPGVREVEQLVLDAIAAADFLIYIEDQYFTSRLVVDALAVRLAEPTGPEVVVVLPLDWLGWLETRSMGEGRTEAMRRLIHADIWGRLVILYPTAADGADIKVHSKLTIIDDRLLRVGSANLSNRSMGLDSECDMVIEAAGDAAIRHGIAGVLHDLVAEHMGAAPETVTDVIATSGGSLIRTIQCLRGGPRGLWPLPQPAHHESSAMESSGESLFADPAGPFSAHHLTDTVMPGARPRDPRQVALTLGASVMVVVALGAAWVLLPLDDWFNRHQVLAGLDGLRVHPLAAPLTIGTFVVGGMTMLPVLGLISLTALVFSPAAAFAYAIVGCLSSATVGYGLGHLLGRRMVTRLAGRRVNRVGRLLRRHGIATVFLLRIAPVAPFAVINVASGAAHVRFRDYALGTMLGMVPVIGAVTLLAECLRRSLSSGDIGEWLALGGLGVMTVAAAALTHRVVARRWVNRSRRIP
ncbi:MAG: VTT domain-containing protein [Alphaproteobacteria bacterium]